MTVAVVAVLAAFGATVVVATLALFDEVERDRTARQHPVTRAARWAPPCASWTIVDEEFFDIISHFTEDET